MKKILLMIAVIIPMSLIFNGQSFWNILAERGLGEYDDSFENLFICNAFGFTALRDGSLEFMLYTLTVCVVYLFMFGHTMSDDLNVSDIYVFIRENRRTKWFVKNAARVFLQSAVTVLINIAVVWYMTAKMGIIKHPDDTGRLVGTAVLMILYIWILVIMANLFSALFGSTIGLSVGAASHYAFVIAARYGFENGIIKTADPLAIVFNAAEGRQSAAYSLISMTVLLLMICTVFCTYVNRSDISLNNKEILA
ncbi:MAG: DUF2705 family protein [Ruminococcus sp.]|nr:DUF2705 family protein [Ruminococcus sp.]